MSVVESSVEKLADVISLFDHPKFQESLLSRITCHQGFENNKMTNFLDVLKVRGVYVHLDWLMRDVCIFYRTKQYVYMSRIDRVKRIDDLIEIQCYGFQCITVDETTPPDLKIGINLGVIATRSSRLIPGRPTLGHNALPMLPSH